MSLSADQILQLPEEQRQDAIEKNIETLSLADIEKLSATLIKQIEQDYRVTEGFANSQSAVRDRKDWEPDWKPKGVVQETEADEPSDEVVSEAIADTEHPQREVASAASEDPEVIEAPTRPLMLEPEQRVDLPEDEEDEHTEEYPDFDDDPAARHGFDEIIPQEQWDPRHETSGLVAQMHASARASQEAATLRAPKKESKEAKERPSVLEGLGTLQFKLMPHSWGLAGGYLAANELASRVSEFQSQMAGISIGMVVALVLSKISKQGATLSALIVGTILSCVAMWKLGVPDLASGEFDERATAFCLAVALGLPAGFGLLRAAIKKD